MQHLPSLAAYQVRLLALIAVLLQLSGCSWLRPSYEQPEVTLLKIEVVKARLWQQDLSLRLLIDNPNDRPLPVRGLDYQLSLGNMVLTEGRSDAYFDVPAKGQREFVIAAQANMWRYLKDLAKIVDDPSQAITYRMVTNISTGVMVGENVHVVRSGEIIPGQFIPNR